MHLMLNSLSPNSLKNFFEPSRPILNGSDHFLCSILHNLIQHASSHTQIATSESSNTYTISLKVGKGKATNKGDNLRVQKYLEDEGIEKKEHAVVSVYLRMAKTLVKRVGWRLLYVIQNNEWEYRVELA